MSTDVAPPLTRRRTRRVEVAAAVAVLAVLLGLGLGGHRWTHPSLFPDYAGEVRAQPRPLAEAATSFTVVFPRSGRSTETVTLTGVRARFADDTAHATATFWVCHLRAGEDPLGAVDDPQQVCRDSERVVAGQAFDYGPGPGHDYLFVTLTPTRPGTTHLAGVDVSYRRGPRHLLQHGTQTIDADLVVTGT